MGPFLAIDQKGNLVERAIAMSDDIEVEPETEPDPTVRPMRYGILEVTEVEGDEGVTIDLFLGSGEEGKEGLVIRLPVEDARDLWNDLNLLRELLNEGFTKLEEEVLKPEEEIFSDHEPPEVSDQE